MGNRSPNVDGHPSRSTAFEKLETQTTFASACRGDNAHHLSVAGLRLRQSGLQDLHVGLAPHEATKSTGPRDIEARA